MQLKVIKADGSTEEYLHTKVFATFSNALTKVDNGSGFLSEQLAEAVTFYLYHKYGRAQITSSEILAIIQAILTSTGHLNAAVVLTEHHQRRNLLRSRIEVAKMNVCSIADAKKLEEIKNLGLTNRWNKSKIVTDLINELKLDRCTARTVASMVEDKILNSNIRCVPVSFIRHLVLTDALAVSRAAGRVQSPQQQTKTVSFKKSMDTDIRLRQSQKGLCTVEV